MNDADALIRELARRAVAAKGNTAMDHALLVYFMQIAFGHNKRGTFYPLEREWQSARLSAERMTRDRAVREGRSIPSDTLAAVPEDPPVLIVPRSVIVNRARRVREALAAGSSPVADLDAERGLLVDSVAEAWPGRAVYRNTRGAGFVLERGADVGLNP